MKLTKKILSLVLCTAMVFAFASLFTAIAANGSGDVNGDGKVNSTDARMILRWAAKLDPLEKTDERFATADMNGDGSVNSSDARLALKAAAKITDEPESTNLLVGIDVCRWCGRTDCLSLSTWDNSKCPAYDILKDPYYYCQTCGYPTWFGAQPGEHYCNHFLSSTDCPDCGEWCDAMTCHHCPVVK